MVVHVSWMPVASKEVSRVLQTSEPAGEPGMGQEEHSPQEEAIQGAIQAAAAHLQLHAPTAVRRSRQSRWHYTSRTSALRKTLRSMGAIRQIQKSTTEAFIALQLQELQHLDMQQILKAWYDKSTFAIATWRGDAQRYWLTQGLDCARS